MFPARIWHVPAQHNKGTCIDKWFCINNLPQVLDISIRRGHIFNELRPADTEGSPDGGEDAGGEYRELDVPRALEGLHTGVVGASQLELGGESFVSEHPLETLPDTLCKVEAVLEAGLEAGGYQAVRGEDGPDWCWWSLCSWVCNVWGPWGRSSVWWPDSNQLVVWPHGRSKHLLAPPWRHNTTNNQSVSQSGQTSK